ncbi:MAG: hypothetical protein OEV60_07960 [Actinomycetota bacterium]|nr:hypothetical protein [Actinomycetota bacterium]MDH5224908.1 hypothetical protein [Actinomycetota bacterium]
MIRFGPQGATSVVRALDVPLERGARATWVVHAALRTGFQITLLGDEPDGE